MQEQPISTTPDEPSDVDEVIDLFSGDAKSAVRALLVANSFLEAEVERLSEAVSRGYIRGQLRNDSAIARLWRGC